ASISGVRSTASTRTELATPASQAVLVSRSRCWSHPEENAVGWIGPAIRYLTSRRRSPSRAIARIASSVPSSGLSSPHVNSRGRSRAGPKLRPDTPSARSVDIETLRQFPLGGVEVVELDLAIGEATVQLGQSGEHLGLLDR